MSAKSISMMIYNGPNEVITNIIDPLLAVSVKALEEKQTARSLT